MSALDEVFISYSWDSEEHLAAILSLSNRLRGDGFDCVLDQYEISPPEGWPRWMDRKIGEASLVLVVCTETYFARVMGFEERGKGLGVKWEGHLIYQHLYNAGASNQKFIPVLMSDNDKGFIPTPLQGASYYTVDSDAGYQRLCNRLLGKPPAEKPPVGQKKPMPEKTVKTDLKAYIMAPIKSELWDMAKWTATAFAFDPASKPPLMLGLAFLNKGPAEEIFKGWHRRYGDYDTFEELRISIVEGPIDNEAPGYTVHVGADYENVINRYKQVGLEVSDDALITMVGRINRMNPLDGESPHLRMFKERFNRFGEYLLVPATCNPDGSHLNLISSLGIRKRQIHLRHSSEIGDNDADTPVIHTGRQGRSLTNWGRYLWEQNQHKS
ncbi:MAG: toll/interleukin-1 receptor domain-containing protein [Edaphobacter sp.]